MKKQIKLTLCSIVAFVSFSLFAGTQNAWADDPTCGQTYAVALPCTGLTILSHNIHGDATGATSQSTTCYAVYFGSELSYYMKIISPTACNTSQGYEANPIPDSGIFMCMGTAATEATYLEWYKCVLQTDPCSETTSAKYTIINDNIGSSSICSGYATTYVNVAANSRSYTKINCTSCPSGKTLMTGTTTISGCEVHYQTCGYCGVGQYLSTSGVCVDCDAGYYSNGGIPLSCTLCPNAEDPAQHTTSNLSAVASVSNNKITSFGRGDINSCYIKQGTYYSDKGAYITRDCYNDNTERVVVTDCSSGLRSFACTNESGTMNTVYTSPNGVLGAGAACWCSYGSKEGKKWLFRSVIGSTPAYSPSSCLSNCPGLCMGSTLSSADQERLGCSN